MTHLRQCQACAAWNVASPAKPTRPCRYCGGALGQLVLREQRKLELGRAEKLSTGETVYKDDRQTDELNESLAQWLGE